MNIQSVLLAEIQEAPFNYNLHPQNQLEELQKSLERFGQFKNIVLWQGSCIAGNGLVFAAQSLGWTHLDAMIRDDLSEDEAKSLCIADNATPYLATPDSEKLQAIFDSLPDPHSLPGVTEEWLETLNISLDVPDFFPTPEEEQPRLDEKQPIICPNCGHEFTKSEIET